MNAHLPAAAVALAAGLLWSGACLGPLVSDAVPVAYLAPGESAPSIASDPLLLAQIDGYDGVDRSVPYTQGFAAGEPVALWHFGAAGGSALPMYILVDGDGVPIDHPPIIDAIPGDPGYTPFCAVFIVKVGNAYNGEQLVSLTALRDARNAPTLVANPEPAGTVRACPVVHPEVTLEQPGGGEPRAPTVAYYQGFEVPMFQFDDVPLPEGALDVPTMPIFQLRREGGEPLSEPMRRVDMTGDGDTHDSNDVLLFAPSEAGFSPAMTTVSVVVGADYASIDTSQDDAVADFMAGADLFAVQNGALDPVVGNVVAWEPGANTMLVVAQELAP